MYRVALIEGCGEGRGLLSSTRCSFLKMYQIWWPLYRHEKEGEESGADCLGVAENYFFVCSTGAGAGDEKYHPDELRPVSGDLLRGLWLSYVSVLF